MVDAPASSVSMQQKDAAERHLRSGRLPLAPVVRSGAAALDSYNLLSREAIHAPPQSAAWIRNWTRNCHPDLIIAALEAEGRPVFALALEVAAQGPFRIARFCGGRHANGNFPATLRTGLTSPRPADLATLTAEVHRQRPDIDIMLLERQIETLEGFTNPLFRLPRTRSPNVALAANLDDGFDALLERVNGPRKRKKHRYQTRKFEAVGSFRRVEAADQVEINRLLTAFFAMKAERFRKMGIADVFVAREVQAFFQNLFTEALQDTSPAFVLHALEVGGKIRAVTGSSLCGERSICDFAGFAEDELAQFGPGEFLLFENIRDACRRGLSVYDLGVGDEPYKRSWCEIETRQFDTILPLTAKGHFLAAALHGIARTKQVVKSNPLLWGFAKRLRKIGCGKVFRGEQE